VHAERMRMRSRNARLLQPLLAALVLAAIVAPVAMATAGTSAAKSKTAKQINALKRQTASLLGRLSALEARVGSGGGGGSAPQVPTTLPPSGPAGGDLTATFPNPQIRADSILSGDIASGAVFTDDIRDGTVTGTDIADGSLERADLGLASVGAEELGSTFVEKSDPAFVGPGAVAGNELSCPPGTKLLSGGAEWLVPEGASITELSHLFLLANAPRPAAEPTTWEAIGMNSGGTRTFILFVKVICLQQ
jgi:hypothetical protein